MKAWDGRFGRAMDPLMEMFSSSLSFDRLLLEEDVEGSMAWAMALGKAGVLTEEETGAIVAGLEQIRDEYRKGGLQFLESDEDVHMAVERILVEKIGQAGEKLHTGRSRNDQVATDLRLHVKRRIERLVAQIVLLQRALLARAESDRDIVAPGYTHLRQAQAVPLAHYWLSLLFALEREKGRAVHARMTADIMPLGAGAIAGSGVPVDREFLASRLGFSRVSENSIDAVASRDFVLETLASCASFGILLSRYAEDLILWSSDEFGFVEIDDAWASGSSMMPQKKNPDSLELIRGKAGRLIGNHAGLAATLKGVGLTYYRDLQEDKEPLFDSLHHVELCAAVFTKVMETLTVRRERIEKDLDPMLWATDLADYLVTKGVPFRQAHKTVGAIVKHCLEHKQRLPDMPLDKLREFSPAFAADAAQVFSWQQALRHRDLPGGAGPNSLAAQLEQARKICG